MGHAEIQNRTPYLFETAFTSDEEGQPLLVPVIKATYRIGEEAQLTLAEKQVPVNPAGQYWGKPEESSYKYEPEVAFIKPATDVVLIGSAYARRPGDTEVNAGLYVGPVQKVVRV